jgi:hypothetical protein
VPQRIYRQSKWRQNEVSIISAKLLDVALHNLNSILISAEPKARFKNKFAQRVTRVISEGLDLPKDTQSNIIIC